VYRFLIDEDSPKGLVRLLTDCGYDAIHVVTAGLSGTKDPQLAVWAKEQDRIIISRDLGFANLTTYPVGTHPGMMVIRAPYESTALQIIAVVERFLPIIREDRLSLRGALVIIEPEKYRIRTL
jgi:predicted nuclease of predicted toxin-antitoxin system